MRRALCLVAFVVACHASPSGAPTAAQAEAALSVPPADVSALFQEALQARKAGDDAAAKAKLDLVLRQEPGFALAALMRADVLIELGHAAQAVGDANLAVKALPHNPRAWKVLGQTLEDAGRVDDAIAAYRKSVAIRDDEALRRRLASLDAREGRLGLAAREWESVRDGHPRDVAAHLELTALYEKLDLPASAEAEYRAVLALVPHNALFHRRFAQFLDRQGKAKAAREERAKADLLDPPAPRQTRHLRPLLPSRR